MHGTSDLAWCTRVMEGGLDIAGGEYDGWLGPDGPREEQYARQIWEANDRLPPQVRGYALFTALPETRWRKFEVTESLWRRLEAMIMQQPTNGGHIPPPDAVTVSDLATASRWHQEEAIREIERGQIQAARDRLLDNIRRMYALELALR